MHSCEASSSALKTKLTHIESKKKSHLPACKQATSLTQKEMLER